MRRCLVILALASCGDSAAAPAPKGACPASAVRASPSLCVDKTEVTVAAYSKCVDAHACTMAGTSPTGNGKNDAVIAKLGPLCNGTKDDRQGHPINCVDWAQAKAYCTWAKGRLPSEAEWELAAQGKEARTYPWGNDAPTEKLVNACGPECAAMFKRTLGSKVPPMYTTSDGFEATGPVGSFPAGASPSGALDMAGNVGEWVADWYEVDKRRAFRGGGWDLATADKLAVAHRDAAPPDVKSVIVGFRCAY